MPVVSYRVGNSCSLEVVADLIRRVYAHYPEYSASRVRTVEKALAPDNPFLHHGDWVGFLSMSNGTPIGHTCAAIDGRQPSVGLISFFEALTDTHSARDVLSEAIAYLVSHGVRTIRAPVDFTTWNGFRVSSPEDKTPFLLEPFTREYYGSMFADLGFSVAHSSVSQIQATSDVGFGCFHEDFSRLCDHKFQFETIEAAGLAAALPAVHKLVLEGFARTWSFVPLSMEEFAYSFGDAGLASARLIVHLARSPSQEPVGFCFGALDWPSNGTRCVLKTICVTPEMRGRGVGRALFYAAYVTAIACGATDFILSTMRDGNGDIRSLTTGSGTTIREYRAYELQVLEAGA